MVKEHVHIPTIEYMFLQYLPTCGCSHVSSFLKWDNELFKVIAVTDAGSLRKLDVKSFA